VKKDNLKPIQKELLRLLKEVTPLLEENKIEYFACGGTMIGAVREKGFIPWDDDIDFFMTRKNYDKLIEVAKKNNGKLGEFDVACGELENSLLPFCKIFDKRYKLNAKGVEGDEDYLFIDIFPFDTIPEDLDERHTFYKGIEKRRRLVGISRLTFSGLNIETKNKLTLPVKYLLKIYTSIRGPKKLLKNYLDFCKKYNGTKNRYAWDITWGKLVDTNINVKDITPLLDMPFEDTKIKVMNNYDEYLTAVFGDYMTPPEAKDRETHGIEIVKE
jgi:lipopolysaccharide cholinephosphotransferase